MDRSSWTSGHGWMPPSAQYSGLPLCGSRRLITSQQSLWLLLVGPHKEVPVWCLSPPPPCGYLIWVLTGRYLSSVCKGKCVSVCVVNVCDSTALRLPGLSPKLPCSRQTATKWVKRLTVQSRACSEFCLLLFNPNQGWHIMGESYSKPTVLDCMIKNLKKVTA